MNEPIDKIFTTDNGQVEQASQQVVNTILGINNESEQLIGTLKARITTQKNIISRLEKDLAKLERKSPLLKSGPESETLKTQLTEAKQLLEEERKALVKLESHLNIATEAMHQLVGIRKAVSAKIKHMKSAGQEDSAQYKEMLELAGDTENTFRELHLAINHIGGNM